MKTVLVLDDEECFSEMLKSIIETHCGIGQVLVTVASTVEEAVARSASLPPDDSVVAVLDYFVPWTARDSDALKQLLSKRAEASKQIDLATEESKTRALDIVTDIDNEVRQLALEDGCGEFLRRIEPKWHNWYLIFSSYKSATMRDSLSYCPKVASIGKFAKTRWIEFFNSLV